MPSVISETDRELLEDFCRALIENELAVGAEFQQALIDSGFENDAEMEAFFSGMLLDEGAKLVKNRFGSMAAPDSTQIIALFDNYLSCLARRAVNVLADASKTRRTLEALRRQAFHYMSLAVQARESQARMPADSELIDEHSGMLTQQGFQASLEYLLEDKANFKLVVVMLDLDYGMSTPENVFSTQDEVIQRLLQVAREGDLVARITPQRWALALRNVKSASQANLAALKLKRQFEPAFNIADRAVNVTSRIGVAIAPDHGNRAEPLQRAALKAVRWSVHNDQSVQFYNRAIDLEHAHSQQLGSQLRQALYENALDLHFQPQFSLSANQVVGLEALLRWDSPEGQVPPSVMLELIEHEGLFPQLTQWLLHTAFRRFARFRREGIDTTLSINLLPQNLSQEEFPEIIAQALDIWKVPADKIILEISESSVLDDVQATLKQIGTLRNLGVRIAMDNFGTGYSSMSYLSQLDIDQLKIDQGFVRSMHLSGKDETIVRAIANLAQNFGLTLVAEGVESEEIAQRVKHLGCDVIQGYLISRPLSSDQLITWWQTKFLCEA